MDTEPTPLPLKKLSDMERKVGNALVGVNVPYKVDLGRKIEVQLPFRAHADYRPKLHVLLGSDLLKFWVSLDSVDALACVAPEFSALPFETLPADVLPIVVESLLLPLLQKIETQTHQNLRVEQVSTAPVPTIQDTLHVPFVVLPEGGTPVRGECICDAAAAAFLVQHAPKSVASSYTFSPLVFPFQACIGNTSLDYETYRQLHLNDVILIENATLLANECLQFSHTPLKFIAKMEEDFKVTVMETLSTQAPKTASARPTPTTKPAVAPNNDALTDHLDVHLAFMVGEKHLTLAELRTLKPGYSFEFDASLDAPVEVHANGHMIGKGELVQINDRVGVRLTEFNEDAVR